MSSDPYLLMDRRIVDHLENARMTLGRAGKHPANPLFERPGGYPDTMYDEEDKIYKMWYPGKGGTHYATSSDGISWDTPELGIYQYAGLGANNGRGRRCRASCTGRAMRLRAAAPDSRSWS